MKYIHGFLLFLLTLLIVFGVSAEELRYGFTLTKVRVRKSPSTSAEILDNLLPDRCVLIQSDVQMGNIHFVGVTYRDASGNLSTGWAAADADGKIYIDEISASQFSSEFGLPAGELPSDPAGTSGGTYHADIRSVPAAPAAQPAPTEPPVTGSQNTAQSQEPAGSAAVQVTPVTGSSASTSQADLIRAAQTRLKELGIYAADITGNIGRKTRIAIKEFQSSQGLNETGELDENTVRLLLYPGEVPAEVQETPAPAAAPGSAAPTPVRENAAQVLTIDSTGDLVYEIQDRLMKLGYYSGNVTGHYGEKTAAAVKLFQQKNGLSATGNADTATVSLILYGQTSSADSASTSETTAGTADSTTYRKGDQSEVIYEMQSCLRSLKLYSGDLTGHFGSKTKDAVMTFQRKNGLTVSGDLNAETVAAIRRAVSSSAAVAESDSGETAASSGSGVYSLDWFTAKDNGVFSSLGLVRGNYATLRDLGSGKSLRVYIQSAGYHLDVEPATAQDTAVFCAIYGVSSSSSITYTRRPALLTTSKGYRIVCSIYGTPHGQQVITNNNFSGQFCLHFLKSRTSGSNKVDSGHQTAIQKAISMSGGQATVIRSASDL